MRVPRSRSRHSRLCNFSQESWTQSSVPPTEPFMTRHPRDLKRRASTGFYAIVRHQNIPPRIIRTDNGREFCSRAMWT